MRRERRWLLIAGAGAGMGLAMAGLSVRGGSVRLRQMAVDIALERLVQFAGVGGFSTVVADASESRAM